MATLQTRPFSRDYSGLINQSVLAAVIATICVSSHEYMKRKRRGKGPFEKLGSVESWQFGYLYQGRCWAKNPSPPHPHGLPLSWVPPVIKFPEEKLNSLRGVDATLYCRFLRGCRYFTLLHTFTTTAILLPIHLHFSDDQFSDKSMDRALISSLVTSPEGLKLLWIHQTCLAWLTITWIYTLIWICRGAYHLRAQCIQEYSARVQADGQAEVHEYYPHPHPQHPFHAMPPLERVDVNRGLRLRTVMVTNIPPRLRSEKELKEYFEYYMSRHVPKPSLGLTSTTQPGMVNKMMAYLFNRSKRLELHAEPAPLPADAQEPNVEQKPAGGGRILHKRHLSMRKPTVDPDHVPIIQRVSVARKMTELASLHDRREEVLKRLETAHIKLAQKVLGVVKVAMDRKDHGKGIVRHKRHLHGSWHKRGVPYPTVTVDVEMGDKDGDEMLGSEGRMELLIRTLGPYVEEFGMRDPPAESALRRLLHLHRSPKSKSTDMELQHDGEEKPDGPVPHPTVWEALFSLPRTTLDAYQPLIHLSALFRGKTVPAIDYFTTKLALLTSLITENRSRPATDFDPVSSAFVTFADPDDARKACKYLAVHPNNPLACFVSMAPDYEDLDWVRLMKTTFKAEFVKDWVVDVGVWVFTISWVIPVSLLVALVSIKNIATVIPGLQNYLNKHHFAEEIISSLIPTVLTSLLMLLIPLILLLIGKKAHTLSTLSSLHDRIMTRYHKFLVANILVFFCVGVSTLEGFFTSFKQSLNVLEVVKESFPSAGPFYVGWLIFTTAMHGGIELGLFGLPLIMYPSTKRQVTPRKRDIGIRPRTFNFYYWLPNHVLIVFISLVFAVLNPLLTPFALIYFCVTSVVIKNQLLHVYAKVYEGNGHNLLIRWVRYTMDGLVLAQVVFLALVSVLNRKPLIALTAIMIIFTVFMKLTFTRLCRAKFEEADILEARVGNGMAIPIPQSESTATTAAGASTFGSVRTPRNGTFFSSVNQRLANYIMRKFTHDFNFTYEMAPAKPTRSPVDDANPFNATSSPIARRERTTQAWADDVHEHMPRPGPSPSQPASPPRRSASNMDMVPEQETAAHVSPFQPHPLVTTHEKHPPWDDMIRTERPYDNPYYVRPVTNHLWLPRNPVGLLNLDDTVRVFKSLTSEPGAGQLGEWLEEGILMSVSGLPSTISSSDQGDQMSMNTPPVRELDGSEVISLPPIIAERASNLQDEEEPDIANIDIPDDRRSSYFGTGPRRPSVSTRRPSSTRSRPPGPDGLSLGRPSTFNMPRTSMISVSASHATPRRTSTLALPDTKRRSRSASVGQDPAAQPDLYAQARFINMSRVSSIVASPLSMTHEDPLASGTARSDAVSTREALVGEVIAEEHRATADRIRKEEAEAEESAAPRSWMTSWMFSKTTPPDDTHKPS
ncbi:hypothetical protein BD410DRAFT_769147 [Rickenella mellea]|uniref:DUF221-domain-containing protein n=1 Tax=Rickenella mellea TaxID=50990 RepID=A0A4Y7Q7S9_9AGAM|nr:hypothetical protein BD410DRAFT_769147 [Rickenella mellea]